MNHFITLSEAIDLTSRYRSGHPSLLQPEYRDQGLLPLSESFDRAAIEALLAQDGCAGIRVYNGQKTDQTVHAVLVAYDANGADILPSTATAVVSEDEDLIVENSIRCPPICPPESPLNS